jgi:hypothetical protein
MPSKTLMIDPPSGWMYGFPKPIPNDQLDRVHAWLVENGYPQNEIDARGDHFYSRYWEKEIEEEKCSGGKWKKDCDDWACVGKCMHDKMT